MSALDTLIRERLDLHQEYDVSDSAIESVRAVLRIHEPTKVYPVIPGTDDLLETPTHAICRECSDKDTVDALEGGDFIDMSDGVRYPCKTVEAVAAAMGVTP